MRDNQKKLDALVREVMGQMIHRKYSTKICSHYQSSFRLLMSISQDLGDHELSEGLIKAFLDSPVNCSEKWAAKEQTHRRRCIRLLSSLAKTGTVDWRRQDTKNISAGLIRGTFRSDLERFGRRMALEGFRPNTIGGYQRMVTYFLLFCQKKGYNYLSDLRTNDVSLFIMSLYREGRYQPTTIGSALSGLRMFLAGDSHTAQFRLEIPKRLPREMKIMETYCEGEAASVEALFSSGAMTKRDTAVCRLLLETGLRGIDVCSLKLKDIDWEKDSISITQSKTKMPLRLPLRASYGNAIADYLLHERPESDSEYVFLRTSAPFGKMGTGSIYAILRKMEEQAGIKKEGRPVGSRMTRHHAASSMLRAGVPMSDISAALGHRDPNVVCVYLSTDAGSLASCTLPMPSVWKGGVLDE